MRSARTVAAFTLLAVASAESRADRIFVRGGGIIKGKAILDDAHPDQYLVFGERGKHPVVFKKDRIVKVEPEPGPLDDYAERRHGLDSAQADYDLGLWCESRKLPDLALAHYEAAIARDADFAPARLKLGHVEHDGKWLTTAERKAAQGYILYRGRWITAEEKAQRDSEATTTAEHQSWARRIGLLKTLVVTGPEAKSREAEAQLLAIDDEAAIAPVVRIFGGDEDPALRKLAARSLAGITGPAASAALVARLLAEPVAEVREATMAQLARSREPNVVPKLVEGLRSRSFAVVNRAAWALGNLNAVASVPKLINSLVTAEEQVVWLDSGSGAPVGNGNGNGNGGGGGGINVGFGSSPPGYGNNPGGLQIPVLTGPTVGPGVVAFGATSVPALNYGAGGGGVSLGTGGGGGSRGPVPVAVQVPRRNVEVHAALTKLTGRDFGYDVETWRRWVSTAFRAEAAPAKQVPQP